MKPTQYIPYIFRDMVAAVSIVLGFPVYFDWGTDPMVTQNLTQNDGAIVSKGKKYPLVWLIVPFVEVNGVRIDMYSKIKVDLAIVEGTEVKWNMSQRAEINYIPTLYPIWAAMMDHILKSRRFDNAYINQLKYLKTDYPYWGKGDANMFNDFVDAILIKDFDLTIKNIC